VQLIKKMVVSGLKIPKHFLFHTLLGSADVACMELGVYNCIVVEKDEEKRRAIRRRLVNTQAIIKPGQS